MTELDYGVTDERPSGWYRIQNEVLKQYGADLGPYGIAVYNALCMYGAEKQRGAWPRQTVIAELIGASRKTVNETLQKLEELGLIASVQLKQEDGSNGPKRYRLTTPKVTVSYSGCNADSHYNKTKETRDSNEADASGENPRQSSTVPASKPNPLAEEYERLTAEGNSLREVAVGLVRFAQQQPNNNRLIAGALGRVYVLCFGTRYPPNFPRLMRMSNRAGGPERLATRMLDVAAREVLGNPHDVLEKWRPAWQDRKADEKENEVNRTWGSWQPQNND